MTSKIEKTVIRLFENNSFLRQNRSALTIRHQRFTLHEQFLEFMEHIPFKVDYENTKTYSDNKGTHGFNFGIGYQF